MNDMNMTMSSLFTPFSCGSMELQNRFVMAPMTRSMSPEGIPSPKTGEYYRRRADGGVGLIITEAIAVDEPSATASHLVPRYGVDGAGEAWRKVVDEVHASGTAIVSQIWHVGMDRDQALSPAPRSRNLSPSGVWPGRDSSEPMTFAEIDQVIGAFARAAQESEKLGFDGIELHAAHGYLVDQFLWKVTNLRQDRFGGDVASRSQFAADIIAACRESVSDSFPIFVRISQWKTVDFTARLFDSPREIDEGLAPLVAAGASLIHCSTRRFWEPEFDSSELTFAGWVRKVTGLPTMTVGSVGLQGPSFLDTLVKGEGAEVADLSALEILFAQEQFDLVAVGRALISDPDLITKVRLGRLDERVRFDVSDLATLK